MAGQTVVKQVTAEIRANTQELDAALQRSEGKLKNTKAQIEGSGAAANRAGAQYGSAARQIASATEVIARSGNVSGEAAKQILSAGSSIAFAFGAGGAVVGALSIFGLAVVTAMRKARDEIKQTVEAFDEEVRRLEGGRDYNAAGGLLTRVLVGDPGNAKREFQIPLAQLEAEINAVRDRTRRTLAGGGTEELATATRAEREAVAAAEEILRERKRQLDEAQRIFNLAAQRNVERLQNAKSQADQERAIAEERARIEKEYAEAVRRGAAAIAAFDRDAADFGRNFDATVTRELASEVDRVAASFDRLIEQGTRVAGASDPRVIQLKQLREAAIQAARAAEELERKRDRSRKLETLRRKGPDSIERTAADIAREIQQAVDGALQLAAAFGDIDANATGALRSIAQIAGNIPALQTAISNGSGVGIISAALPILGAFSTLLGNDPAEEARREELRRNTQAIRELTKQAGLLGIGVSGADAASARVLLQGFLGRVGGGQILAGGRSYSASDQATIAADRLGILDELQEIAAQYGITLNRNITSFEQLADALADTITKLGEFGTDLQSQLQQANAAAEIFGITDPLERLGLTLGAVGGRSSAFDALTSGLDLNTAEGRAQARKNAQALFEILKAGGDTLSPEALGGLSGQELLDAILELVRGLNAVDEATGTTSGTQTEALQVSASTQITADQASRLLGLSASQLTVQREIRDLLAAARQAATTPLPLPSSAVFAAPASAGGVVTITIENNYAGPVADIGALTTAQLDAVIPYIKRALGDDVAVRAQYAGRIVQ